MEWTLLCMLLFYLFIIEASLAGFFFLPWLYLYPCDSQKFVSRRPKTHFSKRISLWNRILIFGQLLTRKATRKNCLQWKYYCLETWLEDTSSLYSWDSIIRDYLYLYQSILILSISIHNLTISFYQSLGTVSFPIHNLTLSFYQFIVTISFSIHNLTVSLY